MQGASTEQDHISPAKYSHCLEEKMLVKIWSTILVVLLLAHQVDCPACSKPLSGGQHKLRPFSPAAEVQEFVSTHKKRAGHAESAVVVSSGRADSVFRSVRADADLYKRIGTRARLFASFGCSSENGRSRE